MHDNHRGIPDTSRATYTTVAVNDDYDGRPKEVLFSDAIRARAALINNPPPAKELTFSNVIWPFLTFILLTITAIYSAYFSIDPSKDESDHLNEDLGIDSSVFYNVSMIVLCACSLPTNGLQALGIYIEIALNCLSTFNRSESEDELLQQQTILKKISHHKGVVITTLLASTAALSNAELGSEDATHNLVLFLLISMLIANLPVCERGLASAFSALPFSASNLVDWLYVQLGWLEQNDYQRRRIARKARKIITSQLELSLDNFHQQSEDRRITGLAAINNASNKSTAEIFTVLLNLGLVRAKKKTGYFFKASRRILPHDVSRTRLIFMLAMSAIMIISQNGYANASLNGSKKIFNNKFMQLILFSITGGVYFGLAGEATMTQLSEAFANKKSLFQNLYPDAYRQTGIFSKILSFLSGGPSADANGRTTGRVPEETVFFLPKPWRYTNEGLGFVADGVTNFHFTKNCFAIIATEYARRFETDAFKRKQIALDDTIKSLVELISTMPIDTFIELLNANVSLKEPGNTGIYVTDETRQLLDIFGDIIPLLRRNGVTHEQLKLLFHTVDENQLDPFRDIAEDTNAHPSRLNGRNQTTYGSFWVKPNALNYATGHDTELEDFSDDARTSVQVAHDDRGDQAAANYSRC